MRREAATSGANSADFWCIWPILARLRTILGELREPWREIRPIWGALGSNVLTNSGADSADIWCNWRDSGQFSASLANSGANSADYRRIWPIHARLRQLLGEAGQLSGANSADLGGSNSPNSRRVWPSLAQIRPMFGTLGANLTNSRRVSPTLARIRPRLCVFGQLWREFRQFSAKLAKPAAVRPTLGAFGAIVANSRRVWRILPRMQPMFCASDQFWRDFDQFSTKLATELWGFFFGRVSASTGSAA